MRIEEKKKVMFTQHSCLIAPFPLGEQGHLTAVHCARTQNPTDPGDDVCDMGYENTGCLENSTIITEMTPSRYLLQLGRSHCGESGLMKII